MSVNDRVRVKLRVKSWADGSGIVVDKGGCEYHLTESQLGPEFKIAPPRILEVLEGVVLGPDQLIDVVDPKTERI